MSAQVAVISKGLQLHKQLFNEKKTFQYSKESGQKPQGHFYTFKMWLWRL